MADYSPLSLKGFEVLPDSPVSMHNMRVSMEQFTEASPLAHAYCRQISEQEFNDQANTATADALTELIEFMDEHPEQFKKTMRKRKKEELENAGLSSFLKFRFMAKIQGEKYTQNLVSEREWRERQEEVKRGMLKAYAYAQEAKGRRYNTRLAAKQGLNQSANRSPSHNVSSARGAKGTGSAPVPPPPPPCPPPMLRSLIDSGKGRSPLGDRTNKLALQRPSIKGIKRSGSSVSMASMASVQQELLATNPLKRLRSTRRPRSPGGTPAKRRGTRDSLDHVRTPSHVLNTSESLTSVFMRIMDEKFKNVRSPSPAPNDSANDGALNVSSDFSP